MSGANIEIFPGAISKILEGPESIAQKKRQAQKIKRAWQDNIHDDSGATDRSIDVEQRGFDIIVAADSSRDPDSAWVYREFGTYDQKATHPGRRAIRAGD